MKLETLRERLEKAEAKIEKKENTIAKKTAQIEKKYDSLRKIGVENPENRDVEEFRDTSIWNDVYWIYCDIKWLKEDIRRGGNEINETRKTIEKYKAQIIGEMEKESLYEIEIPEIFKNLEIELVTAWDIDDKKKRDYMRSEYRGLGYTAFIKKHSYRNYEFMSINDEQIHTANVNDARVLILDLYNRVKTITGEVTDWTGIRATVGTQGFTVLNGIVIGKEGRAKVESIYAGGYNVQRLHVRVLVNEI